MILEGTCCSISHYPIEIRLCALSRIWVTLKHGSHQSLNMWSWLEFGGISGNVWHVFHIVALEFFHWQISVADSNPQWKWCHLWPLQALHLSLVAQICIWLSSALKNGYWEQYYMQLSKDTSVVIQHPQTRIISILFCECIFSAADYHAWRMESQHLWMKEASWRYHIVFVGLLAHLVAHRNVSSIAR